MNITPVRFTGQQTKVQNKPVKQISPISLKQESPAPQRPLMFTGIIKDILSLFKNETPMEMFMRYLESSHYDGQAIRFVAKLGEFRGIEEEAIELIEKEKSKVDPICSDVISYYNDTIEILKKRDYYKGKNR